MFYYDIIIDVAVDWADNDIETLQVTVPAKNSIEATNKLQERLENGYYDHIVRNRKYYIWEVTEDDKVGNSYII